MTFDPQRWSSGHGVRERNTLIPFGAGRRKCIGESFAWNEMLIIASICITRWTLTPHRTPPSPNPNTWERFSQGA